LDALEKAFPIESLVDELRTQKNITPERKKKLWETIKVDAFTRTVTAIYSLCLMDTILSVQVSMIGRHLYMEHTYKNKRIEEGVEDETLKNHLVLSSSKRTQQRFLGYAQHFQKVGMNKLLPIIEGVVRAHISDLSLKHLFGVNDFKELIESIRKQIEQKLDFSSTSDQKPSNGSTKLIDLLLPDLTQSNENEKSDKEEQDKVMRLLNELSDLIESPEYFNIFRETCNCGFSMLYDRMEENIVKGAKKSDETSDAPLRLPMANVSTWLTKELKTILTKKDDMEDLEPGYVDMVHGSPYLTKYCILVYARDLLYSDSMQQ